MCRLIGSALLAALILVSFAAPATAVSRNTAATTVIDDIIAPHPDASVLIGFGPAAALEAGDVIEDGIAGQPVATVANPSWLFWLDLVPLAHFSHATVYVLVDTTTGAVTLETPGRFWPRVNGADLFKTDAQRAVAADRIYSGAGFDPLPFSIERLPVPSLDWPGSIFAQPNKRWLIVAGEDTAQHNARRTDVNTARTALEATGIKSGNITVLNNPDKATLCAAIAGLPMGGDFGFYFTGHGVRDSIISGGEYIYAGEMISKLKGVNADSYTTVWGQCYSGTFLPFLRDSGITGHHSTAVTADTVAYKWDDSGQGGSPWHGGFYEHFYWQCVASGLTGQAAFQWAADSLETYMDSLKMVWPQWKLNCQEPASSQVFTHSSAGATTGFSVPSGTGTVCIDWKELPADNCANATLYCEISPAPGAASWKVVKHWNWNGGKTRYFNPFSDPLATGNYKLVSHANRYPSCGDIRMLSNVLPETPGSNVDFPAFSLGFPDGSGAEFCFPPGAPPVTFQEGLFMDEVAQQIGLSGPENNALDVTLPMVVDPSRPWLYFNDDPAHGFFGEGTVHIDIAGIFDSFGTPIESLQLRLDVQQGPVVQSFPVVALGGFTSPIIDDITITYSGAAFDPLRFALVLDAPPGAAESAGPGTGYVVLDAFYVTFNTFAPVSVPDPIVITSGAIALAPPAPNPSSSTTRLRFELPKAGRVELGIYDLSGRLVRSLARRDYAAGRHEVRWNGRTDRGGVAPAGVYFLRMSALGDGATTRIVRVR